MAPFFLRKKQNSDQKARRATVDRFPTFLSSLNIGTLLFGTILIYILITLVVYLTQEHTTSYEVVSGTISGNYRYSAIALVEEEIETAGESGSITYYAREGSKVNAGMMICSIGAAPVLQRDEAGGSIVTTLSAEDSAVAKEAMGTLAVNFNPDAFSEIYDFKSDLQGIILQSSIDENAGSYVSGSYEAPVSGFVVYATDGLEGMTEEQLTKDLFDRSSYFRTNLRLKSAVSAGDPVYKLVTNDTWSLYFPVEERLKMDLEGLTRLRVRFLKDNQTFSAPIELVEGQDGLYGKITLSSSLVRYVTDRFLDIELILNRVRGLKIPVSSITEKTFVRVPEEYVKENPDTSSEVSVVRETFAADGSASQGRVTASVYSHNREKGWYLLDPKLFSIGDNIIMPDSTRRFQISEDAMETIQGVYNINKGYAVFRAVTVIDENEEFAIVDANNAYGLSAHDRIVLDASGVKDDDIVK